MAVTSLHESSSRRKVRGNQAEVLEGYGIPLQQQTEHPAEREKTKPETEISIYFPSVSATITLVIMAPIDAFRLANSSSGTVGCSDLPAASTPLSTPTPGPVPLRMVGTPRVSFVLARMLPGRVFIVPRRLFTPSIIPGLSNARCICAISL